MIIGVILIIIGFCIRLLAIRTLKDSFSLQLQSRDVLVTKGIYKHVRHPSYTGSLIMTFGLAMIYVPLAITYVAFMFFLARVINEESIINNQDYAEYRQKTGMFIPKVKKWQQ